MAQQQILTGRHLVTPADAAAFRELADLAAAVPAAGGRSGPVPGTVPPAQLAAVALGMCERLLDQSGGHRGMVAVHGVQRLRVERPVATGSPLASTAEVRSVRPLGAATATEVAVRFSDADGAPVAVSTSLLVHGPRAAAPARPVPAPDTPAPAPAPQPAGAVYRITRELVRRYAEVSGDHNPIHLSEPAARAAGFDEVIAHGMLTFALTARQLADTVGEAEIAGLQLRFARPLSVPADGAALTVSGRAVTGGLAMTAADGAGQVVATGRAALHPPRPDRGITRA